MAALPSVGKRDYDYLFKLILLGDYGVGKTGILMRLADGGPSSFISTIGLDFRFRTISIDDAIVKLQIWDTAGQERFRTITSGYIRGSDGAILVYDIANRETFAHIRYWNDEVNRNGGENACKVLVGCNVDSPKRAVSEEEGKALAAELGMTFLETGVGKADDDLEGSMLTMAAQLIKMKTAAPGTKNDVAAANEKTDTADIKHDGSTSEGGCC